ncbi:MAG: RraA family protein [Acidimicrobiales bacterium]
MGNSPSLDILRTSSVPTLANAIELFGVVPANQGFTTRPLMCHFPELGMLVGRAVTLRCSTNQPEGMAPTPLEEPSYWRYLEGCPDPTVVVVEDLDDPPGGAMWGEWNSNVHKALGCVGTITQGAVRDLDAVARLDFHFFSTTVSVAHGYGRFIDWGSPVSVAGLTVLTGDLLVADRHGVLRIPPEVNLRHLIEVANEIDALESEIFELCQSDHFSVDALAEMSRSVRERWPRPGGREAPTAV